MTSYESSSGDRIDHVTDRAKVAASALDQALARTIEAAMASSSDDE